MIKIPNDKLADMYIKMICKLSTKYIRGFYRWATIFQKDLDWRLTEADSQINAIWEHCIEGKASLIQFIGALNIYEEYMLKGFGLYKNGRKK